MNELASDQYSQLVGGGECHIHHHPKEQLDFSDRLQLMVAEQQHTVSTNYVLTKADELVLADTSSSDVTITVPLANNGREFQIIKAVSANTLYVVPTAPDNILGSTTGIVIYNANTSLHLKSVTGGYILV